MSSPFLLKKRTLTPFFSHLLLLSGIFYAHEVDASVLQLSGLRTFSPREILSANAGRLEFIHKRPASSSRADDAAFLIERYLRLRGLPQATVDWSLPGNDVILLSVNEGPARYLGELKFNGELPFDQEKVTEQFLSPSVKSDADDTDLVPYLPKNIPAGEEQATIYLKSLGYWDAVVNSTIGSAGPDGKLPVTLNVNTGPLFNLATPNIIAPRRPAASIRAKIEAVTGLPASSENISKVRQTLVKYYGNIGYSDATFDLDRKDVGATTQLTITIEPGQKYQLRSVQVEGLQETDPSRVTNRFRKLIDESYHKGRINKLVQKLIATGAFERVEMKENLGDQVIDVTLHMVEAKARGVAFSAGAGSYEGFILGARYYDRNWLGRLYNLSTGVEITSLGFLGEVAVTDPFFFRNDLSFTPRAYFVTRTYEGYSKFEGGLGAELKWTVNDKYNITLGLNNFAATVSSEGLPEESLGVKDYLVSELVFKQRYDRRNDITLPSDGYLLQNENAIGLAFGEESVTFFRTEGDASYYKTLNDENALAFGLRGGVIIPTGETGSLPIDLRHFTGGANTVRSFPERELGPSANGFPTGGYAWWVANAEYIRSIKGPMKGVIFLDAGALAQNEDELLDAEVKVALGLGLRIDLPIGPVRLEYGRALNPTGNDPDGTFHFAIGATF